MTTPRIEEEFSREYGGQKFVYANEETMLDFIRKAKQAGIDEAMERLVKHFESYLLDWKDGMDRNDPDIRVNAVIEAIKALQDNK